MGPMDFGVGRGAGAGVEVSMTSLKEIRGNGVEGGSMEPRGRGVDGGGGVTRFLDRTEVDLSSVLMLLSAFKGRLVYRACMTRNRLMLTTRALDGDGW